MDSARSQRANPSLSASRSRVDGAEADAIVNFTAGIPTSRRPSGHHPPAKRVAEICANLMKSFDDFSRSSLGIDATEMESNDPLKRLQNDKRLQNEGPLFIELFELLRSARRQLAQCAGYDDAGGAGNAWWSSTTVFENDDASPARSVPSLAPQRLGRTLPRAITVNDLSQRPTALARAASKLIGTPPDNSLRNNPVRTIDSSGRPSIGATRSLLARNGSSVTSTTGFAVPDVRTLRGTAIMSPDGFRAICEFEIISELGRGNFGSVSLAADQTGQFYAIKTLHTGTRLVSLSRASTSQSISVASSLSDLSGADAIDREIAVMKLLNHPNVVKLYAVIEDPDEMQTHLVMQYIENGPPTKLRPDFTCKALPVGLALHYMRQVAKGLDYLHQQGVVHRDVKPENILIGKNNTAFVADFGVSSVISDVHCRAQRVGTMAFFSPELLASADAVQRFGKESDVWAFGVTLYALVFGRLPFQKSTGPSLVRAIMMDDVEFPETLVPPASGGLTNSKRKSIAPATLGLEDVGPPPSELIAIIRRLLQKDPSQRMTLREFRRHPFVLQYRDTPNPPAAPHEPLVVPVTDARALGEAENLTSAKPESGAPTRRKTRFVVEHQEPLQLEPSDGLGSDLEHFSDSADFMASLASPPVGPTQEDVQGAVVQCAVHFRRRHTSVSVAAANAVSRFATKLRQVTQQQRATPLSSSRSAHSLTQQLL